MSDFTLCSIKENWVKDCIPAIMVPVKGKKCPPVPGKTSIQRASRNAFGDSEMLGYYAKGGYYAPLPSGLPYESSLSRMKVDPSYNTGFEIMVRCDGPVAVAIHMANPSWYPRRGQVRIWDARLSGYANPYYPGDNTYIMSVAGVYSVYYDRILIPDTVADMEIDEIIEFTKATGGDKWYPISQPDGAGNYIVVDGKKYSSSYAIWAKELVRAKNLDAPSLVRYGEHIAHQSLVFEPERLENGVFEAYMNAVEALPKDEINWFATMLDLVELIIAGVTGNIKVLAKNVPQFAADAWLSYRYVYNTTKMDVEDLGDLRTRMQKLKSMCKIMRNPEITTFGVANADGAVIRVSLTYSASDVIKVDNFLDNTERMLVYDAWDLIPFSFIVDWFYSVGDLFHDDSLRSYAMKLQPTAAWCSVSYTNKSKDGTVFKRYFRYRLVGVPGRPDTYSYCVGPNATTLSVKHSLDSLAIVIGML